MHAWVKRIVLKLGALSKKPNFCDISARHYMLRAKQRATNVKPWMPNQLDMYVAPGAAGGGGAASSVDTAPPDKKQRGGGGAWRGFVGEKRHEGRAIDARLTLDYNALSAGEKAAYEASGAAATARHRIGEQSFGPTALQLRRAQTKHLAIAFNRRHGLSSASVLADPHTAIAPQLEDRTDAGYVYALQVLRVASRMECRDGARPREA